MKVRVEVKADILKAMLAEDRQEVRSARSLVYSMTSAFIIASFTLTSILLRPDSAPSPMQSQRTVHIVFIMDACIVPVIWVIFAVLKRHVTNAQKCVRLRQRLINGLDDSIQPYPDLDIAPPALDPPDIKHRDLWWVPIIATAMISLQALVISFVH